MWTKKKSGGTITDTSVNLTTKLSNMGVKAYDSFNRADNNSALGTADTGQAWVPSSGAWIISGNQAKGGTIPGIVTIDPGMADVSLTVSLIFQNNNGIVVRASNGENFITARINATTLTLFNIIAGAPTTIGTYTFTPIAGNTYILKMVAKGSQIQVFLDGTLQMTVTSTFNQTQTKIGLREAGATADTFGSFDEFTAEVAL